MCAQCAPTVTGTRTHDEHGRYTYRVVRLGFKPSWGRQLFPGRFDSCCLPPTFRGEEPMSTALAGRRGAVSSRVGAVGVIVLAVVGLFFVKWQPYFHKALLAFDTHSIGHSILMGDSADPPPASLESAIDYAMAYGKAIWQALLLGLLLGTAVQEFVPRQWLARVLGSGNLKSISAGVLFALPGMMCTCCAIPVAIGLRRTAASAGAAAAFWLGNTVLNPATLIFMGFVLGWKWVGLRLALGIPMVWGAGFLISRFASDADERQLLAHAAELTEPVEGRGTLRGWLTRLTAMSLRLIPEYLVLVLLLGAGRALLFPHIGPAVGNELYWVVVMSLVGLLFVIPTAGEVPIVQAMLALGVGAGPAAALLMTLAPVSAPSLVMARQGFSSRVLGLISVCVFAAGVAAGLLAMGLAY